jgi:hypothetical protein
MNLEPCDIIFAKSKRNPNLIDLLIQKIITWVTGSPYFHVTYFIRSNLIFEVAAFRRAGYGLLDEYKEYDVKRLNFDYETRKRILSRIVKTENSPYGWGEVLAIFLRKKLHIPVYFDSKAGYECAEELVKAAYAETGVWIVPQTTGDISPQDLWESEYLIEVPKS